MQEVEECSFDVIECHRCTELMSAIGRMTKDIEATPSLWHMAGDTSQPYTSIPVIAAQTRDWVYTCKNQRTVSCPRQLVGIALFHTPKWVWFGMTTDVTSLLLSAAGDSA